MPPLFKNILLHPQHADFVTQTTQLGIDIGALRQRRESLSTMRRNGLDPVPQVGFTDLQFLGCLADADALAEGDCSLFECGVKSTP